MDPTYIFQYSKNIQTSRLQYKIIITFLLSNPLSHPLWNNQIQFPSYNNRKLQSPRQNVFKFVDPKWRRACQLPRSHVASKESRVVNIQKKTRGGASMREWNDSGMTNNEREREKGGEGEILVLIITSKKHGQRHESLAQILGPDRHIVNCKNSSPPCKLTSTTPFWLVIFFSPSQRNLFPISNTRIRCRATSRDP